MNKLVTIENPIHRDHQTKITLTLILMTLAALSFLILHSGATYVEMEKTHGPHQPTYHRGENILFTITLTVYEVNGGPIISISDLNITDTLPDGLSYVPGSQVSDPIAVFTDYGNGTLEWVFGPSPFDAVAPHANIHFNVTVDNDAPENIVLLNVAEAFYRETDSGVLSNPSVTESVNVVFPILDIDKECTSGPIHEGDPIIYNITLTNTGHENTINLTVVDSLGDVHYFGGASATSGKIDDTVPGQITWYGIIGNVTGVHTVNITIPVVDDGMAVSRLVNNTVQYVTQSPHHIFLKEMDNCSTLVIHPVIFLMKSCMPSSIVEPANITYTYTVQNIGDTLLYNVTVYDETLALLILGPIDLDVSEIQHGNSMLLNVSAGKYHNEANATGVDVLGLEVQAESEANCEIREKPPDLVGGEIAETITDEQRYMMIATLIVALAGIYLVSRKS